MTTVHDIGDAFGTDDESDAYFIASAERWGAKLKAENPDLVWIDPAPEWISDADWIDTIGALIRPPATGNTYRAVMRLMLPGGSPRDEVRITVEYERCDDNLGDWVTSHRAENRHARHAVRGRRRPPIAFGATEGRAVRDAPVRHRGCA